VQARPFRSLPALCLSFFALVGLATTAFAAGEKDKAALKLHESAMNEDYLNVEFPKAEKKLKDALKTCGNAGCSPAVVAKIHVSLGTVYGVGMNKMDAAKTEFKAALKVDSGAGLDKSLATPELVKAFDEAKGGKSAPTGDDGEKPTKKAPGGDLPHTPTAESGVNSPVPIYIDVPSDLGASKVTLRYKPFGGTAWKSVTMAKMGDGFGAEIPCDDTTTTGEIKYYITVSDDSNSPVAQAGTLKEPYRVTVKNELEGEAPHLPGKSAPKQCAAKGECPPGLPGCPDAPKKDGKPEGGSCEANAECASSSCLNGTCAGGGDSTPSGKTKRNVVGAYLQFDMTFFGSKAPSGVNTGVCSPNSSNKYACFQSGTSHQSFGFPDDAIANTDSVDGGFAFAGIRALVGYDRQLSAKIPVSLGIRFGVAPGGTPSPDNAPQSEALSKLHWAPVPSSPPIHTEVRLAYSFGNALYETGKFHPFVFIGGGYGHVSASVPVTICDQLNPITGTEWKLSGKHPKCGGKTDRSEEHLDAYQLEGNGFTALGFGSNYGITDHFGIAAELKVMFMLPTFGIVLSPTLGPIVAF
jgi:hypothetical protein